MFNLVYKRMGMNVVYKCSGWDNWHLRDPKRGERCEPVPAGLPDPRGMQLLHIWQYQRTVFSFPIQVTKLYKLYTLCFVNKNTIYQILINFFSIHNTCMFKRTNSIFKHDFEEKNLQLSNPLLFFVLGT